MKRYLVIGLVLSLVNYAYSSPSNSMSISPSATNGNVDDASDENARNNEVSTKFNAHDHNDIDQTANTLNVGDATAGDKSITAYNADSNKPYLKYDDSNNAWVVSIDGVNPALTISSALTISGSSLVFEGVTDNAYETFLTANDPTADRTQNIQDNNGVIPLATAGNTIFFTTSGATNVTLPTSGTLGTGNGDMAYADTRFTMGVFTRDTSAVGGSVSYTGVGFAPKAIYIFGFNGNTPVSFGVGTILSYDGLTRTGSTGAWGDAATLIKIYGSGSDTDFQTASLSSFDSDGFTLSWTKTNTPTGTASFDYLAFR